MREPTKRWRVSFILEQEPKKGGWRVEWSKRDVEAAVRMEFTSETGGHKMGVGDVVVKRMRPRRSE